MKIVVSACLTGENCKYNGGNNCNQKVLELMERHEVISVCPEVLGGLPVPRIPAEIVDGVVMTKEGQKVDFCFRSGAEAALKIAKEHQAELVILQSRSPSCGVKQIYDGSFSKRIIDGQGIFAKLLLQNGFRVLDIEDLEAGDYALSDI